MALDSGLKPKIVCAQNGKQLRWISYFHRICCHLVSVSHVLTHLTGGKRAFTDSRWHEICYGKNPTVFQHLETSGGRENQNSSKPAASAGRLLHSPTWAPSVWIGFKTHVVWTTGSHRIPLQPAWLNLILSTKPKHRQTKSHTRLEVSFGFQSVLVDSHEEFGLVTSHKHLGKGKISKATGHLKGHKAQCWRQGALYCEEVADLRFGSVNPSFF